MLVAFPIQSKNFVISWEILPVEASFVHDILHDWIIGNITSVFWKPMQKRMNTAKMKLA